MVEMSQPQVSLNLALAAPAAPTVRDTCCKNWYQVDSDIHIAGILAA
jgi:hypothetical protein